MFCAWYLYPRPGATGWELQKVPLSYGGHHFESYFVFCINPKTLNNGNYLNAIRCTTIRTHMSLHVFSIILRLGTARSPNHKRLDSQKEFYICCRLKFLITLFKLQWLWLSWQSGRFRYQRSFTSFTKKQKFS